MDCSSDDSSILLLQFESVPLLNFSITALLEALALVLLESLQSTANVGSSNESLGSNGSCSLSDSEISESKMKNYIYIK